MRLTVSPLCFGIALCLAYYEVTLQPCTPPLLHPRLPSSSCPPLASRRAYPFPPNHKPLHRLPRCPFCKRFKPVIGCVADALKGDPEVAFYRFEGPSHEDMKDRFAVSSYPTLRFFPKGFILDASYFGKGATHFGTHRRESRRESRRERILGKAKRECMCARNSVCRLCVQLLFATVYYQPRPPAKAFGHLLTPTLTILRLLVLAIFLCMYLAWHPPIH